MATTISSSLAWSFWGAFNAYIHGGSGIEIFNGAAMGAVMGAVPSAAWATTTGRLLISAFSAIGLTQAVSEMQSGQWGLGTLDAMLSLCPLMLTSSQLTVTITGRCGDYVTIYRGVNSSNVGYAEALEGMVSPNRPWWKFWVSPSTPFEHNAVPNGTLNSPYTSWTSDYDVALNFATRPGGNGVVLEATVPRSQIVQSPNTKQVLVSGRGLISEAEVLVENTVQSAKITLVKSPISN